MKARDVDVAWTRACDGLGLSRVAALTIDEASVLLKYLLAEQISAPDAPPQGCVTHLARTCLRQLAEDGLGELEPALSPADCRRLQATLQRDTEYSGRIIDLAVSDLISEPMAPEVCIAIDPVDALPVDGTSWTHAILFHAAALVTHEIYPLTADALVHDARQSGPRIRVIGVHGQWLTHGVARRALYLDSERDRFVEVGLTQPIVVDSVQLLALGERQSERHRCWTSGLHCPQLNPCDAATVADDKHEVRRRWQAAGLPVAPGQLLLAGDRTGAHEFFATVDEIVIKPNGGTEGDRVLFVRQHEGAESSLDAQLTAIWEWGPALIEQRRDGVGWRDPDTGRIHSLALRLHVTHDGTSFGAESGYAQLGDGPDEPATRATGGRMLPIAAALASLVCRSDGSQVRFDDHDLEDLRKLAESAAAFHDGLGLAGIDIVLDTNADGSVSPVLLEINPRPAGLAHSRFLPGAGEGRCEAGVSLRMWDGIADVVAV